MPTELGLPGAPPPSDAGGAGELGLIPKAKKDSDAGAEKVAALKVAKAEASAKVVDAQARE
jgi:hypothetical protein